MHVKYESLIGMIRIAKFKGGGGNTYSVGWKWGIYRWVLVIFLQNKKKREFFFYILHLRFMYTMLTVNFCNKRSQNQKFINKMPIKRQYRICLNYLKVTIYKLNCHLKGIMINK